MSSPPFTGGPEPPVPSGRPTPIDPSSYLPSIIVWSTFNIASAWGNLLLLVLSLRILRLRSNYLLLALHFAFFITCGSGSMLIWTGYGTKRDVPSGMCKFNAAAVLANVPIQGGAVLGLVGKVWTNTMGVFYPGSRILEIIGSTPVLLIFPYLASIPLFLAALVKVHVNPSAAARTSPFYCTVPSAVLGDTASVLGASFTFLALVCAGWTGACVARSRWRVRSLGSRGGRTNYQLVVRVLMFSVFVAVAFVCGVVSLMTSFSAVAQDVVLSFTGLAAFFIFASDKDILALVLCSTPHNPAGPSTSLSSLSFAPPPTSQPPTNSLFENTPGTTFDIGEHPLGATSDTRGVHSEGKLELPEIKRLTMSAFGEFQEESKARDTVGEEKSELGAWQQDDLESAEESHGDTCRRDSIGKAV